MAIWLNDLSTDRLRRDGVAPADGRPFAVYAKSANAFTLVAVDAGAAKAGLFRGMSLADARAIAPDLAGFEAEPEADARLLDRVASWADRFTPIVALDPPDGLFLDVTGVAHLFGGEASLLEEAKAGLQKRGLSARLAIAPSAGAAWASAHFDGPRLIASDRLLEALSPLPVAALRLDAPAAALLARLGLKTIGHVAAAPRRSFSARAGEQAMRRLDQAMARTTEAFRARRPLPRAYAQRRLVEPLLTLDGVLVAVEAVCADLCRTLEKRGCGARLLRLSLYGVEGRPRVFPLGLTGPERDAGVMLRLLRERLRVEAEKLDAEFGIEIVRLEAVEIAPIDLRPSSLVAAAERDLEAEARLADAIAARLGRAAIGRIAVRDAHAPDLGNMPMTPEKAQSVASPPDGTMRRPLTIFQNAQPIEAVASVPDGPPARFRWRRVLREVARAEGPERIDAPPFPGATAKPRDYYRVEDASGRRYWLYREGLYGETADRPQWFLHGLFS
jgi:protein ImuB